MAEYFEITFILDKEKAEKEKSVNKIHEVLDLCYSENIIKKHKYQLFSNQEVFFDVFPFEDENEELHYDDFLECRVSFTGMTVTPKNLDEKIHLLSYIIGDCLKVSESIVFAMCMYEGTYHYFYKVKKLKEFDKNVLSKIPLLFFRNEVKSDFSPYISFDEIYCVFNKYNFQDIFADPITIAKEDWEINLGVEESINLLKEKYKEDFKYFHYE